MLETMWLKIICAVVITSSALAADELLDTLYGVGGRNKMSICVRSASGHWRRCDGALYNREWIIARALCLSTAPKELMTTVRLSAGGSCDDIAAGYSLRNSRDVRARMMHPWFDLALVIVNRPYNDLDSLANSTSARIKLQYHGVLKWMKFYFDAYALTRNTEYHMKLIARDMKTFNYPIWMFFMTILMPTVLFILFFIYITFYTGSPSEVPYKNLHYSKKVTQV